MNILGIETSCDETAAAVVVDGRTTLSSAVASSLSLHAKTGGIIPEVAARKQIEYIIPIVQKALTDAFPHLQLHEQIEKIDAIAVTYGPGLIGSLLVGVETAKTLSYLWDKPLIGVNHLVAHIYASWIHNSDTEHISNNIHSNVPEFPLLALVISGGHTDLVLMNNHSDITWIGGTRDDAAGEAFDKTARLMGLPYPGGPEISKAADKYFSDNASSTSHDLTLFPRPMISSKDFDWSFSGLKTSVLNYTTNSSYDTNHIAAEIQEAIVDVLISKSMKAIEKYKPKSFIIGGGVSANKRLREKFLSSITNSKMKTTFHVPAISNSTDNAAVIASCAFYNQTIFDWKDIFANPELSITD